MITDTQLQKFAEQNKARHDEPLVYELINIVKFLKIENASFAHHFQCKLVELDREIEKKNAVIAELRRELYYLKNPC